VNWKECGRKHSWPDEVFARRVIVKLSETLVRIGGVLHHSVQYFLWRYSPNLGLGLPPWNSPFHLGFLDLRQSVGLLGRVISSSQGLYLYTNTEKRTQRQKHQTSMPLVGFELTIPASERAKTVHALDRSATVTGTVFCSPLEFTSRQLSLPWRSSRCNYGNFLQYIT
jgi:hypothetical protein